MLKVEGLEAYPCRINTKDRLVAGPFTYTQYQTVIVKVTSGREYGLGEAMTRHTPEATALLLKDYFPRLLAGRDFERPEDAWKLVWQDLRTRGHTRGILVEALSAVDIALWDLYGKNVGKSIARLLSRQPARSVPVYAGSVFSSRGEISRQLEKVGSLGVDAVKVKIGFGVDKDITMLKKIRRSWGDFRTIADANGVYDKEHALRLAKGVGKLGLAWLEEPVASDDLEGYRSLAHNRLVRLGAGETWFASDFDTPVSEKLVDVIEPSVSRCGGIGTEWRVAGMAAGRGLKFAPMVGVNSAVSLAASLQVAAAAKNLYAVEFDPFDNPLVEGLAPEFPRVTNGRLPIPQEPGLGIDVDLAFLKKYAG
jgi:L-alanine-DL-glutamate epimerase-like enolase superfamily enzyme